MASTTIATATTLSGFPPALLALALLLLLLLISFAVTAFLLRPVKTDEYGEPLYFDSLNER